MIELLHTDCMHYMATLPDAAFDLAIVDPPYGRGEDGGTNRCHGVKQKNGTVLQCLDGGYAKKDCPDQGRRLPVGVHQAQHLRRLVGGQFAIQPGLQPPCGLFIHAFRS